MAAHIQKVQLLADALAADFHSSRASAACTAALARLLPGLGYLSISVSNPAQDGAIVASSNCATEGPTNLHLHDPLCSAAGRALALDKPLHMSLLDGATAAAVLPTWTDVQAMVAHAPGIAHLLCVPFGHEAGEEGGPAAAASTAADSRCWQHVHEQGSVRGALLFGFSVAPELDARRKVLLAMLARCLPAPMARQTADTLAFVNFACGSYLLLNDGCCCVTEEDGGEEDEDCFEQEEEEEAAAEEDRSPSSPCREDDRGAGGGAGASPSQALLVPEWDAQGCRLDDNPSSAGPNSHQHSLLNGALGAGSSKAGAGGAEITPSQPARLQSPGLGFPPSHANQPTPRFSKAALAAVGADGDAAPPQSPVTLAFHSAALEQEFARWILSHHLKSDMLFFVLLLAALALIALFQPVRVAGGALINMWLAASTLVLLAFTCCLQKSFLLHWRETLVAVLRLSAVAVVNMMCIPCFQVSKLACAESLAITAIGLRTRLRLHLPLQLYSLAVVWKNIPRMCAAALPDEPAASCFYSSAAMAAVMGYALPTVILRAIEQRSRATFVGLLRSSSAHLS